MDFKKETIINKPIHEVWEILGNQYGEAYQWASGLYHSKAIGEPRLEGAACNNRDCETSQGKIKEVIRDFDPQNHVLAYEVIEGFPFFIDMALNTWTLTEKDNTTKVNMHLVMKTKGFVGALMTPMMKLQMNGVLKNVMDDFKYFVEKGQPSPRKAKEIAKLSRKAA